MRLALQTVICCCVFTTVLPMVKGATGDFNSGLKKRFRVRLQSRMKREGGLVTASEQDPEICVGPQQKGAAETPPPPSSLGLNVRSRRSIITVAKKPGCVLFTCAVHDLIHSLHQFSQSGKKASAPEDKIRQYGRRRRRSLLDVAQLALQWSIRRAGQGGQGHITPPRAD